MSEVALQTLGFPEVHIEGRLGKLALRKASLPERPSIWTSGKPRVCSATSDIAVSSPCRGIKRRTGDGHEAKFITVNEFAPTRRDHETVNIDPCEVQLLPPQALR